MKCGNDVPSEASFCAGCGTPVPDPEVTRVAAPTTRDQRAQPKSFDALQTSVSNVNAPALRSEDAITRGDHHDRERVIFTARPTLLFVGLGYAAAALGAILLIVLIAILPRLFGPGAEISPLFSVPLALALLLIPAYKHLKRNMVRYTLTDSKIEIDRGFLSRTTSNIPLRNIQNVTVTAGLLQRLLRFGDVVIDDASEQVGSTTLRNIPDPRRHADLLLRELRRWR